MTVGKLKGLDWDVEHGATVMLRLSADPAVWGGLVPYQLRMMQEQAMGRLLPVAAGEENGRIVLHYELAGKRRLVQRLYAEPPTCRTAVELVHTLVRTVADCKTCMLQESGFLLHEDFVYAGRRPTDFKLCYLPLEGAMDGRLMPPATEQLRLLLLRLLAFVKEPLPAAMTTVFGLMSQEPYSIKHLEQSLRKLRYGGAGDLDREEGGEERSRVTGNFRLFAGWMRKGKHKAAHVHAPVSLPVHTPASVDKTGLLVHPSEAGNGAESGQTRLVFASGGMTETAVMEGDRFLIGRNAGSVHYVIGREDVSRIHCEISRTDDGLAVTDLGSLNGTLLNGQPMLPYKHYPFGPGDVLQVTGTTVRLAEPGEVIPAAPIRAEGVRNIRQGLSKMIFPSRNRA